MCPKMLDAFAQLRLEHVHWKVACDLSGLIDNRRYVGAEIRLGQENDRRGSAFARHQQVPLEATQVEVGIESHHDEDDVDVRCDHLLAGDVARPAARERAAPRQHGDDDRAMRVPLPHDDPVAHGG